LERDVILLPPGSGPPNEMTGWSGDGAPLTGSLRDFAIGAVTQHFPKTLGRVAGVDFILPTDAQLDAMEAFQRSLGRSTDFDLSKITFKDANVNTGKAIFINGPNPGGGTCNFCHADAGALDLVTRQNRNFDTNVEELVNPARGVLNFPIDGGFGRTPNAATTIFGDNTFNTASVVEAADTPPFFHNNVVQTLEDVVRFYGGPVFNRTAAAPFSFNETQVTQVANFMRAINTLQNIDVASRELGEILAIQGNPRGEQNTRLQTALSDTQDAIKVLNQGGIFPAGVAQLNSARGDILQAARNPGARRGLIKQAVRGLEGARAAVATILP
jgi:hypothetical protein